MLSFNSFPRLNREERKEKKKIDNFSLNEACYEGNLNNFSIKNKISESKDEINSCFTGIVNIKPIVNINTRKRENLKVAQSK